MEKPRCRRNFLAVSPNSVLQEMTASPLRTLAFLNSCEQGATGYYSTQTARSADFRVGSSYGLVFTSCSRRAGNDPRRTPRAHAPPARPRNPWVAAVWLSWASTAATLARASKVSACGRSTAGGAARSARTRRRRRRAGAASGGRSAVSAASAARADLGTGRPESGLRSANIASCTRARWARRWATTVGGRASVRCAAALLPRVRGHRLTVYLDHRAAHVQEGVVGVEVAEGEAEQLGPAKPSRQQQQSDDVRSGAAFCSAIASMADTSSGLKTRTLRLLRFPPPASPLAPGGDALMAGLMAIRPRRTARLSARTSTWWTKRTVARVSGFAPVSSAL